MVMNSSFIKDIFFVSCVFTTIRCVPIHARFIEEAINTIKINENINNNLEKVDPNYDSKHRFLEYGPSFQNLGSEISVGNVNNTMKINKDIDKNNDSMNRHEAYYDSKDFFQNYSSAYKNLAIPDFTQNLTTTKNYTENSHHKCRHCKKQCDTKECLQKYIDSIEKIIKYYKSIPAQVFKKSDPSCKKILKRNRDLARYPSIILEVGCPNNEKCSCMKIPFHSCSAVYENIPVVKFGEIVNITIATSCQCQASLSSEPIENSPVIN